MTQEKNILVDSCIISNLMSTKKDLARNTHRFLIDLIANGNILFISEYTHYEILRGVKDKNIPQAEEILNAFISIPSSIERLNRATRLYIMYSKYREIKNFLPTISDMDIFIGSLIFTDHQPLLLTADYCDFPRPFFGEVEHERMDYKKKNGQSACQYYYFLEANLDVFIDS